MPHLNNIFCFLFLFSLPASGAELGLYIGFPNPAFYKYQTMIEDSKKVINAGVGFMSVSTYDDSQVGELKRWVLDQIADNEVDVLWLPGVLPSVLYPNPNLLPDNSLIEDYLETGNMIINVGDYFAYCTYENGFRGLDNGPDGEANILNIPGGITRILPRIEMEVTPIGISYLPTLNIKNRISIRPIHLESVEGDWTVKSVFESQQLSVLVAGEVIEEGTYAGSAVLFNQKTGSYIALLDQNDIRNSCNRGDLTAEFLLNWVKKNITFVKGDLNNDSLVNIFDLVLVASQFGAVGSNLIGDINIDGIVNIFDLVIVAGNFGNSLAAAPSMAAKIELTTQQKHHIALAIDQLESNSNRSNEEEMVLGVLQAILPERLPTQTQLLANYPNPFNPETWIPFKLAQDSTVTAKIYDVTGKQIRIIELGHLSAGNYVESNRAIYWDGKTDTGEQVSSGTYFYQIEADGYTDTRKMVILK